MMISPNISWAFPHYWVFMIKESMCFQKFRTVNNQKKNVMRNKKQIGDSNKNPTLLLFYLPCAKRK